MSFLESFFAKNRPKIWKKNQKRVIFDDEKFKQTVFHRQ